MPIASTLWRRTGKDDALPGQPGSRLPCCPRGLPPARPAQLQPVREIGRPRRGRPPSRRGRGIWWEILVAAPFFALLAIQAFLRDYFGVAHNDEIVVEALFNTNGGEAAEFLLHNSRGIAKHFALLVLFLLLYGPLLRVGNRILPSTGPVIARGEGERPAGNRARLRPLFLPLLFLALFLLLHLNPTMRQDD